MKYMLIYLPKCEGKSIHFLGNVNIHLFSSHSPKILLSANKKFTKYKFTSKFANCNKNCNTYIGTYIHTQQELMEHNKGDRVRVTNIRKYKGIT